MEAANAFGYSLYCESSMAYRLAGMQQITDWLNQLGMSEYAQRFVENGIDLSVLPDLTEQDLKEMGVILGHRRKILRAIANLEAEKSATVVAGALAVPDGPPDRGRGDVRRARPRHCPAQPRGRCHADAAVGTRYHPPPRAVARPRQRPNGQNTET